jgi:hypothetical protein
VLSALIGLANTQRKFERHMILVEWIERQRRAKVSECASSTQHTENHDDQGLARRPKQRALRNHSAQASRPNKSSKGYTLERKQAQTRSILSTIDPSRVSKVRGKEKTAPHQKLSTSPGASQSAQSASIDPTVSHPRSKRMSKAKDAMPTPFRPIHSSKVSKSKGKRPIGPQASVTEELRTADQLHNKRELWPRPIGQKPRSKPAGIPMRRSTRISKKLHGVDVQL